MLTKTLSLWRRVLGKPESAQATAEDRRLWVRYPSDLTAMVQEADLPGEDRVPARVRDLSLGGANLLLDKAYRPGQILSVELPSPENPDRSFNLLACVVRASEEPTGRHSLGCIFSRELTEDDLYQFGARRVRHAPEDQRTWVRFPVQLKANFHKVGEAEPTVHETQVLNVSASGIGLEVAADIPVGALLNLHITGKQGQEHTMLACVVHRARRDNGAWELGCNFIRELSESDFQDLI